MVVRLRLSPHRLHPTSKDKVYHIVACNAPKARDSQPLETLGIYDPIPRQVPTQPAHMRSLLDEGKKLATRWTKRIEWDRSRVQYWIGTGAQPTKRIAWLLQKENLIPPGKVFHGYYGPKKPKKKVDRAPAQLQSAEPAATSATAATSQAA